MAGLHCKRRGRWRQLAAALSAMAFSGCAMAAAPRMPATFPAPPAVPPGQARVWFYRDFLPGESMALAAVSMNGGLIAYSAMGTSFYRDVPAGQYHVTVDSVGRDSNQSQHLLLVPGQEVFVKIMSLTGWMLERPGFERPTYYARAVSPRVAALEMPLTRYQGGN